MAKPKTTKPQNARTKNRLLLRRVDLSKTIDRKTYDKQLLKLQHKITVIQQAYLFEGRSAVIVFEGWDAAGKGGTIRRLSAALDPRSFKVWPIGAPRPYYLDRHWLARFWPMLPPRGAISAFDRSWYGRVLVERVENLTPKSRWKQGYDEINDFERTLTDHGTRIVKVFMHVSPEEQLRRFEERLSDPIKRWKLSYEDFRNRGKWPDYERAIDEMFARTSTKTAPWLAIPANDKRYARLQAIEAVVKTLSKGVDLRPPSLEPRVVEAARDHLDLHPTLIESLAGRTD
ncbi:MAG: polyphosphate kinase [Pseudomonadota bacterium]